MYRTALVSSRLLHLRFRIPEYRGSISPHCVSVKSVGYGLRVSLTFFHALNICVKHLQVSLYLISYITFFEEDVDIKYMSIYKEDKNKKDGFEHLISLQGCGITAQETFFVSVGCNIGSNYNIGLYL